MSYQVLARKYRPASFNQLVGQEAVCRTLKNALESQRIHHAYLFTGTRGVGKTSLARLVAKCLNCQEKITATPCEQCAACQAIRHHRFSDLIEVDAASRTKVEDIRDLLADVHYAPIQGRYKIYLIDEIHMLSSHSFNALLKTLEEPPPHVVFLLATTDPQRLPATILSRCLQFHLKALSVEQITLHLESILKNESVSYERSALQIVAHASKGSLRDALSLLDQGIAYAQQNLTEHAIKTLLGSVASTDIMELLIALIQNDITKLWALIEQLNEQAVDFLHVVDELLVGLHQIAITQALPPNMAQENDIIQRLAQQLTPEDTQLYYQIALLSRRDLILAPTPRLGFEMTLLRMLTFRPLSLQPLSTPVSRKKSLTDASDILSSVDQNPTLTIHSNASEKREPLTYWITLLKALQLTGVTSSFARQCALHARTDDHISLLLDPKQTALHTPKQEEKLTRALSKHFGKPINLSISLGNGNLLTPARYEQQQKNQRLQQTTEALQQDPLLQSIMKTFDATIQPESLHFLDEKPDR